MIIITKKLHPRRLVAGCALFALALGVLGAGLGLVRDIQSAAAVADLQVDPRGIKTNADRVAFLEGYGWIVSQEPAAVEDIRLPDTFDASYDEYLSLQKSQGFDLSQYAGKTVKRYTYQVSNYPGLQENIWASLLLYKKRSSAGRSTPTRGTASSRPCPTPPKPERVPPQTKTTPPAVIPRWAAFLHRIQLAARRSTRQAGPASRSTAQAYRAPRALLPTRKSTTPGRPRVPTMMDMAPRELNTACQP